MSKGPQWTFGRFVWHELSTPDMARSQAFYSELLGWKYQSFSGGSDPYQLILVDGAPLGGLVAGDATQLMAYVSVPDVDAAAAATAAGGGTVLVHPLEVPGVGRLAVLADAGGAAFSILRNAGGDTPDRPARPGQFAWHQLECAADATHAAAGFYAAVLGWTITPGASAGAPVVFRGGDRPCAGLSPSPAASSRWLGYLAVEDLSAARQRAVRLGGRVLLAQVPVADGRAGALIADSLGTVFGLMAI